jgi:hypothetical protein
VIVALAAASTKICGDGIGDPSMLEIGKIGAAPDVTAVE